MKPSSLSKSYARLRVTGCADSRVVKHRLAVRDKARLTRPYYGTPHHCSICGGEGHRRTTCPERAR